MKYGLIGEKLGHSFSVPIHKAFHNPEYGLKEIPKDEVDAFMEAKDFRGLNVTIPYKQTVMPHCILDDAAKEIGAKFIELHTGAYANAFGTDKEEYEFQRLLTASKLAQSYGITVNAGHGLNYKNVLRMKEIPNLHELNIGHSIISRAVFVGLKQAVMEMKNLI